MNEPIVITLVAVLLIVLSAFFVAVEFASLAAKRHRLEDKASSSRSARAALRSSSELTVLLAGSQLGITICTLMLGAFTKPAVHHWLTPLFETWGLATWASDAAGFALALIFVTFLHLVVGEMAPKSWAIAHPETSATMLALPMRFFMFLTRPALRFLNSLANKCLERLGVEPSNELASGQTPEDLRHLVEHSISVGALDASFSGRVLGAIELEGLSVGDLLRPDSTLTIVSADASAADVRAATRRTGHLRVLVGSGSEVVGVVHVRDTLGVDGSDPVSSIMREAFFLDSGTPVYAALKLMRETRNHLALVRSDDGDLGVVTLSDVLSRLFPDLKETQSHVVTRSKVTKSSL